MDSVLWQPSCRHSAMRRGGETRRPLPLSFVLLSSPRQTNPSFDQIEQRGGMHRGFLYTVRWVSRPFAVARVCLGRKCQYSMPRRGLPLGRPGCCCCGSNLDDLLWCPFRTCRIHRHPTTTQVLLLVLVPLAVLLFALEPVLASRGRGRGLGRGPLHTAKAALSDSVSAFAVLSAVGVLRGFVVSGWGVGGCGGSFFVCLFCVFVCLFYHHRPR